LTQAEDKEGKSKKAKGKSEEALKASSLLPFAFLLLPYVRMSPLTGFVLKSTRPQSSRAAPRLSCVKGVGARKSLLGA
jgi:hypothetical protein